MKVKVCNKILQDVREYDFSEEKGKQSKSYPDFCERSQASHYMTIINTKGFYADDFYYIEEIKP